MKPIIYVGSSVTNSTDAHRRFVAAFKEELRSATSTLVIEWIGRDSVLQLEDFFKRDLNNVRMCNAMIAIVDEPSIGIGMEIQEALACKTPLICLYQKGRLVSRLLLSAQDSIGLSIKEYRDLADAVEIASAFIESLPAGKVLSRAS